MNVFLNGSRIWTRQFHKTSRFCGLPTQPIALKPSDLEHTTLQTFRDHAFIPQQPFLFSQAKGSPAKFSPAATKWFSLIGEDAFLEAQTLAPYIQQFREFPFPYELVVRSNEKRESLNSFQGWLAAGQEKGDAILAGILQASIADLQTRTFSQLFAPLNLLIKALEFNHQHVAEPSRHIELYIAQSSIGDLPEALQDDLPTPELVLRAGKGDVYSSSIWLGTEPTYTPLHRDPNPNLFCQLCNSKIIRLLPPASGDRLFYHVKSQIRQRGNSRIRTMEMMEGAEREALHTAVWEEGILPEDMIEAELGPGDALFIPNGWWHSVKSKGSRGYLNGSANWWFR